MFVKRTRVSSGNRDYEYLSLVEAFRDESGRSRQRTIARLGEVSALRASGDLERIITALQRFAGTDPDSDDPPDWEAETAPAWGATAAVAAVWDRLRLGSFFDTRAERRRLGYSLADAMFAMVVNRLTVPSSKRAVIDWIGNDQAMPPGFQTPSLNQLYWSLDQLAAAKDDLETHLWSMLTHLTNLELSLVCYDLTSTYFEGATRTSEEFPSRVFGYSRDKRSDRPQIMIGLLCTADGLPIAHRVWPGNTNDAATLPTVLADLRDRFAVGRICVVADRGLISADNLNHVTHAGFAHILATRLHRDQTCRDALAAAHRSDQIWVTRNHRRWSTDTSTGPDGRAVVVFSTPRRRRDLARTAELVARTETKLSALEKRVNQHGRLADPGRIGRAAQRILGDSGVARLFDIDITERRFLYHYNETAMAFEDQLAGHYVLVTDLTHDEATALRVTEMWHQLRVIEARFRTLKDFLGLRPVYHWTEQRVRGHVALCVLAAVIEAVITADLRDHDVRDPDLPGHQVSARRALRELQRIRQVNLTAGTKTLQLTTRTNPLQARILTAVGAPTSWPNTTIT